MKMEQVQIQTMEQLRRKTVCKFEIVLPNGKLQEFLDAFYSMCNEHAEDGEKGWGCKHWTERT